MPNMTLGSSTSASRPSTVLVARGAPWGRRCSCAGPCSPPCIISCVSGSLAKWPAIPKRPMLRPERPLTCRMSPLPSSKTIFGARSPKRLSRPSKMSGVSTTWESEDMQRSGFMAAPDWRRRSAPCSWCRKCMQGVSTRQYFESRRPIYGRIVPESTDFGRDGGFSPLTSQQCPLSVSAQRRESRDKVQGL